MFIGPFDASLLGYLHEVVMCRGLILQGISPFYLCVLTRGCTVA
ncbi:hypothetical protein GPLA_3849 [Paraglaciecola polaris LMG 21857]|uniref:Uncharacterized protein n=1 Tax=Paraglaciecola polaris LMG 21857 TaxID=1129793 RepID=K6YPR6_9ALTE|nr:hypothetical protein GPLA_3849 [Paraglaciecola polaris LMG 21857]